MEYPRNDELLSAYLDRELSPDERAAMDRLLERSPEARECLRELEVTSRFVRRLPHQGVETDLAEAVIDQLRRESILRPPPIEPVRRSRRLSWRISGPLAAAATLLIAVWMMHRHEPTSPLALDTPPSDSAAASDRWGQLKEGDFFDLVGPDGESQFQLIVVGKQSDTDPVRCFLIDKMDRAEISQENSRVGPSSAAMSASPLALEANRDQLDALEKAYALASSLQTEPFPIVDINVRADGLTVDELTAHAHSHFDNGGTQPVLAQQTPSEEQRDLAASAARTGASAPHSRPSDGLATSDTAHAAEMAQNQLLRQGEFRRPAQPTQASASDTELPNNEQAPADAVSSTVSQSERGQKQFIGRIESVRQRPTSEGVGHLVGAPEPRLVRPSGGKDKSPPGRVEVLLQLKRHSDSEHSDR